ncbi:MAG: heavy metal translocating P-type ATPase, partial [Oscillospiraceae bacterium]|nr:heavy metal translocating P-type ATPase [Oscillospiraceae bacterium]
GKELEIPAEQLKINDIFLLKSGQAVPVDGIVLEGHSAVNESALTGESLPVEKQKGDTVTSGTLNQSGFLRCQATRVGENTTLSQMIQLVSDASATKAPIAKTADKVSGIFVPTVLGISLLTFIVWLFIGKEFSYALTRAISVLVISCPCSLGLATPVSIMVGNGVGAKNGILFKTASSLEQAGKIQIIALDKTGTVTTGQPEVTDILSDTPDKLLEIASALEAKSEHPLAKAILRYAQEQKISIQEVSDFHSVAGNGLTAVLNQKSVSGGNFHFICSKASVPEEIQQKALAFAQEGKTAIYFTENQKLLGVIAVADKIKPDSAEAVKQFQNMGIQVVMLTGDHPQTAQAIAQQAGIQNVIADVLPDGKAKTIQELQKQGFTAMIGDGINDAPALTCADTGMAIGAGTDVAIDAADVVLMKNSLLDAVAAIRLSRATLKNIHQNLFWAFLYNSIGIPLAAGALIFLTGWELPPMFGAAAMSLSSFCVVTNALRLNLVKIKNTTHDKILKSSLAELDISNIQIERPVTEFTMKIDGMMCPHCEATVKKTLEAFPEVAQVTADFQAGTAIIQLNDILTHLEEMKQAVIDQGYEVLET